MGTVKCIGILTSGGDAPGMNAAIRAVTHSGLLRYVFVLEENVKVVDSV